MSGMVFIADTAATYLEFVLCVVFGYVMLDEGNDLKRLYQYMVIAPVIPAAMIRIMNQVKTDSMVTVSMAVVCMFLLLSLLYREKWYKTLLAALFFNCILAVCDVGTMIVLRLFDESILYQAVYAEQELRLTGVLLSKICLAFFILAITLSNKKRSKILLKKRYWYGSCVIAFCLLSLSLFLLKIMLENIAVDTLFIFGICFILFEIAMVIVMEYFILELSEREEREAEMQLLLAHNELLATTMSEREENMQGERMVHHDFKNILIGMQSLLKADKKTELNTMIEGMMERIHPDSYVHMQNQELEMMLNQKRAHAKQFGIEIALNVDFPKEVRMTVLDLCILFGNLLDNAIENARKVKKPQVVFVIKKVKEYRVIKISNTYQGAIIKNERELISTKKEKNHGIGLKNVEAVVERYRGSMDITYDENWFYVTIMILDKNL